MTVPGRPCRPGLAGRRGRRPGIHRRCRSAAAGCVDGPVYAGTVCLLAAATAATHRPGQLGRAVLAGGRVASLCLITLSVGPASIRPGDGKPAAGVDTALGWLGRGALFTSALAGFMAASLFAVAWLTPRRARVSDHIPDGPFILPGAPAAIVI